MKYRRLFITGIPTSGKSYLAKRLAEKVGGIVVSLDDLRESLAKDDRYKKWTNFYIDLNEKEYLVSTRPEVQWKNLIKQSEGLWPAFLEEIKKYESENKPVIFECVNILPHLAKRDLDFEGIVLVGSTYEEVLKRNTTDPRWGSTIELQELEARTFFEIERPRYIEEANKYSYRCFEKADDAFEFALQHIS